MSRPRQVAILAAVLAPLSACIPEPDPELAVVTQEVVKCPSWGCGGNSPVIDVWGFHELDANGAANSAGVRLVGLVKKGREYRPLVVGARLIGRSRDESAYPSIGGTELIGASFVVDTPGGSRAIHIRNVSRVTPYWIGSPTANETYELEVADGSERRPLCANPPAPDADKTWPAALEALLFAGERYDAQTKEVIATDEPGGGWFNIACAGSALAKLHLNRHTSAGAADELRTTAAQRQALLKMYTSDVCGTGQAFTRQGEPLHWATSTGALTLDGNEASFEALWTERGALCLDEHRLEADPDFPGIHDEIVAACEQARRKLSPCTKLLGANGGWAASAYILSANP